MVKEVIENNNESNSNSNYVGNNGNNGRLSTAPSSLSSSSDIQGIQGYYDEVVNIPPGLGTVVEVTFPEPGTYFGNDHDVGSILYGAGFVVIAE